MAIAEFDSGDETISSVGTAQLIGNNTITDNGSYTLEVELDNMVDGDKVEIYMEKQVTDGGGYGQELPKVYYTNDQGTRRAVFPFVPNIYGLKYWINQTAGTARTFGYTIYKYS